MIPLLHIIRLPTRRGWQYRVAFVWSSPCMMHAWLRESRMEMDINGNGKALRSPGSPPNKRRKLLLIWKCRDVPLLSSAARCE